MKIRAFTGMLTAVLTIGIAAGAQAVSPARYGKLPLSFEPNRGQADPRVQFVSRGAGYTIFLSPTSATFALQPSLAESAVVRMDLLGANPAIAMQPQDRLPGIANYLMGSTRTKWPTNLPTYAKTRSRNVYPGIDLVYYGAQGQLEYDFVLAPQSDPSTIRLKFAGATPVVDASGDLVLPVGQSDIRFHKPSLYQQRQGVRQPVIGKFTVAANKEVSFQVGAYDHSRELVIDPVLVYASFLGGSSQQSVINGTPGVFQPTCFTSRDYCGTGFVTKLSPAGDLVWSTFYGSPSASGQYGVSAIALDADNNVYIAHNADGAGDLPYKNGTQGYTTSGVAYVGELSSDGSQVLFGTFFGSGSNVFPTGMVVDAAGSRYLTGYTAGALPLVNAYQSANAAGFNEGFFAKIAMSTLD